MSAPAPLTTPDAARAAIAGQVAAEHDVKAECHSRLVEPAGTAKGVIVLLHGLGSCPAQMAALAAVLADDGYIGLPAAAARARADRRRRRIARRAHRGAVPRRSAIARSTSRAGSACRCRCSGSRPAATSPRGSGSIAATSRWRWSCRRRSGSAGVPSFVTTGAMNLFGRLPSIRFPYGETLPHTYDGLATRPARDDVQLRPLADRERRARSAGRQARARRRGLNEHDDSISNDLALALAGRMQAVVQALPASLQLPSDAIDPLRPGARIDAVYPLLVSLVEDVAV